MADPLTLAAVGAGVITEGIKFLYGQAAEVLKRWRDRNGGSVEADDVPISVAGADAILAGGLEPPRIDFDVVERVGEDLKALAGQLSAYASEIEPVEPSDSGLLETVDAVRRLLEVIYGQRITFKNEERDLSGPVLIGSADVDRVLGDVAGVRARTITKGRTEGSLRARVVEGKGAGVDVDHAGD